MQERKEEQSNREWKRFLDVLRVLATFSVVLMHTVSGVLDGNYDLTGYERRRRAFLAIMDVTSWGVPVFLMISGYLFLDPRRKITARDMGTKFCRRIVLAILVFGIPYSLAELVGVQGCFRADMIPQAVYLAATGQSWAHMWYLYLILILYLITPPLRWLLDKLPDLPVILIMAALALGSSLIPYVALVLGSGSFWFPANGIYLFYYLCGYVFVKSEIAHKDEWSKKGWIPAVCFTLTGGVLLFAVCSRFLDGYEIRMSYEYPITAFLAILIFGGSIVCEQLRRRPEGAMEGQKNRGDLVQSLSRLSFGIYLTHPVFLNFCYKFLKISPMNFRFFIGVPLFFLLAFTGAAITAWILRRIPLMRRYVL